MGGFDAVGDEGVGVADETGDDLDGCQGEVECDAGEDGADGDVVWQGEERQGFRFGWNGGWVLLLDHGVGG